MNIMKITTDHASFEKNVNGQTVYVFDEFGKQLRGFESNAKNFIEFNRDVIFFILKNPWETLKGD